MKCTFCNKDITSGIKNPAKFFTFERVCEECDLKVTNAILKELKIIQANIK